MAIINVCGFEAQTVATGGAGEVSVVSGSPTISTSVFRSGRCSLKIDPASGGARYVRFGRRNASGLLAVMARTTETFFTFYVRTGTTPSVATTFAAVTTTAGVAIVSLSMDTSRQLTLVGSTTSSVFGTLTVDTWHRIDVRATTNATCYAKLDGGAEQSCTGTNNTIDYVQLGRSAAVGTALDLYFDDVVISDSGFPGAVWLRPSYPTGAGANTGWTNGTGSTFAEVDDLATGVHDVDTTYISASATQDNAIHDFAMQNCSTIGVAGGGSIVGLMGLVLVRTDSTTGTSNIAPILFSGGSSTTTGLQPEAPLTYECRGLISETDPATSVAWTQSGVDAMTFGMQAGTLAQVQRCTALLVYVIEGVAPAQTPDPVALKLTTVAPTVRLEIDESPVALRLTAPAPTTRVVASPTPVALQVVVPAPTVVLRITPDPVALRLTVPEPTADVVGGETVVSPDPVGLRVSVPIPTVTLRATVGPVALSLTAPAPAERLLASPTPVELRVTVPAPTVRIVCAQTPVALRLTTVAPTVLNPLRLTADPVSLRLTVPAPIVRLVLKPDPVALRLTVPAAEGAVSAIPPLYLDASYHPLVECNASYHPAVSLAASARPTLNLNASYLPSGEYNASYEPEVVLAGSNG